MSDDVEYVLWHQTGHGQFDYSAFPNVTATEVFAEQIGYVDRQIKKMWRDYYRNQPNRRIAIVINEDRCVNAIAIPFSDPQVISLSAGMLVRLRQMFMFAACDAHVFPRRGKRDILGNAKQLKFGVEASEILEPADLAVKGGLHSDNDYLHLYGPIPHTRSRLGLAKSLTTAAIDFVGMHEFAHIARNHSGLTSHSPSSFSEATGKESVVTEDGQLMRRLYEVDADQIGAKLSMLKFTSARTLAAAWNGWADHPGDGLRLWLVAVMMTLMLFEGWSSGLQGREYPHPAVRLHLMMAAVLERLPKRLKIPAVLELAREAVNAARTVWVGLGLPMDRMHPFLDDMDAVRKSSLELNEAYTSRFLPKLP